MKKGRTTFAKDWPTWVEALVGVLIAVAIMAALMGAAWGILTATGWLPPIPAREDSAVAAKAFSSPSGSLHISFPEGPDPL